MARTAGTPVRCSPGSVSGSANTSHPSGQRIESILFGPECYIDRGARHSLRIGKESGVGSAEVARRSVAQPRHLRERLVALDDAPLDRVTVGTVVDEVPRPVGDLARVLGRGGLAEPVDEA